MKIGRSNYWKILQIILAVGQFIPPFNPNDRGPENFYSPQTILRTVFAASTISIPLVLAHPELKWELIQATPGYTSGVLTAKMPYLDSTGKIICPEGNNLGSIYGKYKSLATLSMNYVPPSGQYQWLTKQEGFFEERDLPFVEVGEDGGPNAGGTFVTDVLCSVVQGQFGYDSFENVAWIPAGWADDVVPAVSFYEAHKDLIAPSENAAAIAELSRLCSDINPLIAVTAVQQLLSQQSMTPDTAIKALLNSDIAGAGIIMNLLENSEWVNSANNNELIINEISKKHSFDLSAGVAVGVGVFEDYEVDRSDTMSDNIARQKLRAAVLEDLASYKSLSATQKSYLLSVDQEYMVK